MKKTIRQARVEKGLSQLQLAYKIGMRPETISDIETGRGTILQTLCAICKVLDLDINEVEGVVVKKRVGKHGWQIVERPFNVSAE
jgi:DNA-binding XRE family transcriptional regulator